MKKLIILIFSFLYFFNYAQNYQLTNPDGVPYTDGQTISVAITKADLNALGVYGIDVVVQNLTAMELPVRTLRENIALPDGMIAYVCFGDCDPTEGAQLAMNWDIKGAEETFYLDLKPNGITGLCQFKVDFMTPEQNMTLYFDIDVQSVGVQERNDAKVSLSAFPNPAPVNSKVSVNYTLADKSSSHRLVIKNIVGAEVFSMPLNPNDNKTSIETSSLLPGIYFYAIENKNQISIAKKLIVK